MGTGKKDKFSMDTNLDDDQLLKKNRINKIEQGESKKSNTKKTVIILTSIIAMAITAILITITFFYDKPANFLSKIKKTDKLFEDIEKDITTETTNIHIKNGKDSYNKKYYNDAITEFNEVIESDASDKDKAIALTYLGMINDDRGEYDKAIDYHKRALVYDKKIPEIYKNLSLAYRHKKEFEKAVENAKKSLELDSKNLNTRILLGNIYFELGRYDDAVNQYSDALKLSPENSQLFYNLGAALYAKGDEFAAMEYFKKAGASDRIGEIAFRSYSRLGTIYSERNVFDLAEKYLRQATAIRPNDATARYNLGVTYLKQNKKDKALTEFIEAEKQGHSDVEMLENIAEAYFSLKDYDKSLSVYKKISSTGIRNSRILSRIADIYYGKGDLDMAYETYKKIALNEPLTENARIAYLNMGNLLDDALRYEEAIEAYKKAISINKKDDSVYYNIGIAYKHAEKPELAIKSWKQAAELNPKDPKALLAIANYYLEKNHYDLAEIEYQNILNRWPDIQEGHFKIATIYYKRNNLEYAYKAFKKVIEINNNNDFARRAYINSAIILSKLKSDEDSLEESEKLINKALILKPGDPETLFSRGIILSRKQMHNQAIETFYMVIKASNDSELLSEAYNNIGKSYYKQKLYKKALQSFTRGIEENPRNEEIRMNRKVAMQAYENDLAQE